MINDQSVQNQLQVSNANMQAASPSGSRLSKNDKTFKNVNVKLKIKSINQSNAKQSQKQIFSQTTSPKMW